MNITTALPTIPPAPMPASDAVGRENLQRTAIKEPASSPQNGTATDAPASQQARKPGNNTDKSKSSDESSRSEEAEADGRKAEDKRESERTPEEQREIQQEVQELKNRDAEVRTHEQAHAAVGGQYAGSPSYEYERGPDGKSYAVGGEVPIDVSVVPGDPQATIQKMQVVRRAALAPAEPSSADRSIAAEASVKAAEARAELAQTNSPNATGKSSETEGGNKVNANSEATGEASNDGRIQGPVRKSLEGEAAGRSETESTANPYAAEASKTLSSAERGNMIADFYSRRVSPSETGFSATA